MENCLECGAAIPWRPGVKNRATARFCGNPCKYAWQKRNPPNPAVQRETRPCATCGEPVSYLPSQRRPGHAAGRIYCSRKCKGAGHSKLMTGRRPSGGVYTSNATFRKLIRPAFLDRCAICGWDEAPCDVAHIVARKAGGNPADPENVVMLCPNHHRMFDTGRISAEVVLAARPNCLLPAQPRRLA